jgi:Holliday junction resolvase RusA-like endonuclease
MIDLSFEVYGQPVPQGSAKGFVRGGRAVITSDNPKLRPWREAVTWAARDALGTHTARPLFPLTCPVILTVSFWLRRPSTAPRTVDVLPTKAPDLDKLARSVGDSLVNAGAIKDDALVVDLDVHKRYAVGPDLPKIFRLGEHRPTPGALITVECVE